MTADEWGAFRVWLVEHGRKAATAQQYSRYARRAIAAGVRSPDDVDGRVARSVGERSKAREGLAAYCEFREACA